MPLKKPLKNPFKKPTFEQKRKAFSVIKKYDPSKTNLQGDMRVNKNGGHVDLKKRKIERESNQKRVVLQNNSKKLIDSKSQSNKDAKKKQELHNLLIQEMRNVDKTKLNAVTIRKKFKLKKIQDKIIEIELLDILKNSNEFQYSFYRGREKKLPTFKYDPSELRKSYQYFLETSGKTFVDLTINDVQKIFNSAVKNTKK